MAKAGLSTIPVQHLQLIVKEFDLSFRITCHQQTGGGGRGEVREESRRERKWEGRTDYFSHQYTN